MRRTWLYGDPCTDQWTKLECSDGGRVRRLNFQATNLAGILPDAFSALGGVDFADLRDNALTYPSTAAARVAYDAATIICRKPETTCLGVPPNSCTAFGDQYRLSLSNPFECDECPASFLFPALKFGGIILLALVAVIAYVLIVMRHPEALARWVSTLTILFNHAQTLSILGQLGLAMPVSADYVFRALSLDVLKVPDAACLFSTQGAATSPFWRYATGFNATMLIILTLIVGAEFHLRHRGKPSQADKIEFVLTIVFAVQLPSFFNLFIQIAQSSGADGYGGGGEPLVAFMVSLLLLVFQVLLLGRFTHNIHAFHRGSYYGEWRLGTSSVMPRSLDARVRYFTLRFASHAPRWQLILWLRQFSLVLIALAAQIIIPRVSSTRYLFVGLSILVLLVAWAFHSRWQPYAYRYQNTMEGWLYSSNIIGLALAALYSALVPMVETEAAAVTSSSATNGTAGLLLLNGSVANTSATSGAGDGLEPARVLVEILLFAVLLGSVLCGAVYSCVKLRKMRGLFRAVDVSAALLTADEKIDGPLRDRVLDGSIRLMSVEWLLSAGADAALGVDANSGAAIMKRRQDLPDEAFLAPVKAAELLEQGQRSILALSYRWLTALHPDPAGTTLAALRRHLREDGSARACGLFWDFASLPQKGEDGSNRSAEDAAVFKLALEVMGFIYASVTGTTVLQLKVIAPRPAEYDGMVTIFGIGRETTAEADFRADMSQYGDVMAVELLSGQSTVTFSSHEAALAAVQRLVREGRPTCETYNATAYSAEDVATKADPYSGWCTFEQGVASMVAAHLSMATSQAEDSGRTLPDRLLSARASRAKVIDISPCMNEGRVALERTFDEPPEEMLRRTVDAIASARFVGKGDMRMVQQMLYELEWTLKTAMDQAELAQQASVMSTDPRILKLRKEALEVRSATTRRGARRAAEECFSFNERSTHESVAGSLLGSFSRAVGSMSKPSKPPSNGLKLTLQKGASSVDILMLDPPVKRANHILDLAREDTKDLEA